GPKAHWQGEVHAASAIIAGRLTGSILVRGKIEIGARAVIHGRVTARHIAMARGATVDGEVHATGREPILEFEARRGAPQGQDEPAWSRRAGSHPDRSSSSPTAATRASFPRTPFPP